MPYKLRFVQRFKPGSDKEFLLLEKEFIKLEENNSDFPRGKRYRPYSGREPSNTLIWECEFDTLADLHEDLSFLENSEEHEALFRKQVPYMLECYTEIYESI